MTEFIAELFSKIFNDNVILATILVSMIPIMELKGGIPFGMSEAFWGEKALGRWQAFGWAYLGCSIVVVILYFTSIPMINFLRKTKIFKGIANFIDTRIKKQSDKINKTAQECDLVGGEDLSKVQLQIAENKSPQTEKNQLKKRLIKLLGVFLFVAIPLPLTGIWMGTTIAVFLNLRFWETFATVQLGNLIAGIIISTICVIFPHFTHLLIYIFLIMVLIVLMVELIKYFVKNKQKNKN